MKKQFIRNRRMRYGGIAAVLTVLLIAVLVEVSVYPDVSSLKAFCEGNDIDIILIYSLQVADTSNFAHTRVFAPKFGYLEDPATGSGNSAFANYLLSENMWDGSPITIEQGGNDRIFNAVKLKTFNGKVLFGGRATRPRGSRGASLSRVRRFLRA